MRYKHKIDVFGGTRYKGVYTYRGKVDNVYYSFVSKDKLDKRQQRKIMREVWN